jgi:hypothetical protein
VGEKFPSLALERLKVVEVRFPGSVVGGTCCELCRVRVRVQQLIDEQDEYLIEHWERKGIVHAVTPVANEPSEGGNEFAPAPHSPPN